MMTSQPREKAQRTGTMSVEQGPGCCPSARLGHEPSQSSGSKSKRCIPPEITMKKWKSS